MQVPILTFHKVDKRFEWGVTRVTPLQFKQILSFLKTEGYSSVSISDLFNSKIQLPEKPVILNFDDSYENIYTNAFPLMQSYKVTSTIFIITGYVGKQNLWDVNVGWIRFKHLSWDQIKALSDQGFEFGSHSVNHPDLTRIRQKDIYRELDYSKKEIEDKIGKKVRYISFPFGRYNDKVIDVCKKVGYEKGCGFYFNHNSKTVNKENSFVLKRKAYYLFDGQFSLQAKLGRKPYDFFEDLKLKIISSCSYGTFLIKSMSYSFFNHK
ncbi:MAG: polysaccharide deacetylase family protein [bacterium]